MASLVTETQREAFVRRVRLEMAKSGLTREALAEKAGCKERTLGNLLAGERVRDTTLAKVARVLAIALDDVFGADQGRSPGSGSSGGHDGRAGDSYGGYLQSAYESYIGTYVAYRWVFADRQELSRSVYEFDWDDELHRMRFFELQRFEGSNKRPVSSSHAGGIHISPHTGLMQLLTTYQGALRLVTLSKFRLGETKLRGAILTQSDRDMYYQPAVSPIFLEKLDGRRKNSELERLIGQMGPKDAAFAPAAEELGRIAENAVYFAGIRKPASG
ncbi:MAG: multiprotein-bridging factor 1 family protein [Hyphomicrobiaceae bacterium]